VWRGRPFDFAQGRLSPAECLYDAEDFAPCTTVADTHSFAVFFSTDSEQRASPTPEACKFMKHKVLYVLYLIDIDCLSDPFVRKSLNTNELSFI
jgi:hypothetical protein